MKASAESSPEFDVEEALRIVRSAVTAACGPSLRASADDIAQTVMARVLSRIRKDPANTPRTASYLWRTAHHAVIDEVRRRRRRPETVLEEPGTPALVASNGDPERAANDARVGGAITDCVDTLSDDRKLAVTLFLQGHGVTESSRIVGWPHKRVENLVYRGLAAVRACLQRKGVCP